MVARRGPLRRQRRLPRRPSHDRLALPRLRHQELQRQQALRPIHPRATRRRLDAERHDGTESRQRLQPPRHDERRGGRATEGILGQVRFRARPGRQRRLARPHDRMRRMPRSQVRPDLGERLLQDGGVLRRHPRAGALQRQRLRQQIEPAERGTEDEAIGRDPENRRLAGDCPAPSDPRFAGQSPGGIDSQIARNAAHRARAIVPVHARHGGRGTAPDPRAIPRQLDGRQGRARGTGDVVGNAGRAQKDRPVEPPRPSRLADGEGKPATEPGAGQSTLEADVRRRSVAEAR